MLSNKRILLGFALFLGLNVLLSAGNVEARTSRPRNRQFFGRNFNPMLFSSSRFRFPQRFSARSLNPFFSPSPFQSQPALPIQFSPQPAAPGHDGSDFNEFVSRPISSVPDKSPKLIEDFENDLADGPSCVDASLKDCRTLKQIVSRCSTKIYRNISDCKQANGEFVPLPGIEPVDVANPQPAVPSPSKDCGYPKSSGGTSLQVVINGTYLDEETGLCKEGRAGNSSFTFPFQSVTECEASVSAGQCRLSKSSRPEINKRPSNILNPTCGSEGIMTVAFMNRLFVLPEDLKNFQKKFSFKSEHGTDVHFKFWPNAQTNGIYYINIQLQDETGRTVSDASCQTQETICEAFAKSAAKNVLNPLRYCKPDYNTSTTLAN